MGLLYLYQVFDLLCDFKPTFVTQVTDVIISPLTCALFRRETLSALYLFPFKIERVPLCFTKRRFDL